MAALLVEICEEVQLTDFERAFIIYLIATWLFVLPFSMLRVLIKRTPWKKNKDD